MLLLAALVEQRRGSATGKGLEFADIYGYLAHGFLLRLMNMPAGPSSPSSIAQATGRKCDDFPYMIKAGPPPAAPHSSFLVETPRTRRSGVELNHRAETIGAAGAARRRPGMTNDASDGSDERLGAVSTTAERVQWAVR
jgi:hypothetical protein